MSVTTFKGDMDNGVVARGLALRTLTWGGRCECSSTDGSSVGLGWGRLGAGLTLGREVLNILQHGK